MANAADQIEVGVLLPPWSAELGEWLADATAFEAAGADALWVGRAPESELDPVALTAALAALTYRSLLVMAVPDRDGPPGDLGRALGTIRLLCHGRLALAAGPDRLEEVSGLAPGLGFFAGVPGEPGAFERTRDDGQTQRWVPVPPPEGRAAWRTTLLDATRRGARGVLVPADPRLLDILRNPDDPGDRRDLKLAQG